MTSLVPLLPNETWVKIVEMALKDALAKAHKKIESLEKANVKLNKTLKQYLFTCNECGSCSVDIMECECENCNDSVCSKCISQCSHCGDWVCPNCYRQCNGCDTVVCVRHSNNRTSLYCEYCNDSDSD